MRGSVCCPFFGLSITWSSLPQSSHPGQDRLLPRSRHRPGQIGQEQEAGLRELYLEAEWGRSYLTLGKQQVVWGKADGLKVLDVVNPQSFRGIHSGRL
jgi:hypothetical protein